MLLDTVCLLLSDCCAVILFYRDSKLCLSFCRFQFAQFIVPYLVASKALRGFRQQKYPFRRIRGTQTNSLEWVKFILLCWIP